MGVLAKIIVVTKYNNRKITTTTGANSTETSETILTAGKVKLF